VLAGAAAEEEATGEQTRTRGCRVRHDRRVDADQRACHARSDPEAGGRLRDAADHRPHERAVPLAVDPGMDVVGDEAEAEARFFGELRVADQVGRCVLFRGQGVAELHPPSVPACDGSETGYADAVYSEVATLQVLLEGVPLPASKHELIRYAHEQDGGRAV